MKVLIIDPWCSDNYEVYTIGLCEGLSDKADITLCSSYYESRQTDKYCILRLFFKKSDKMGRGKFRNVVRGIEYILAYEKILSLVKTKKYDVIHVEWALLHKIDKFFLKKLRKHVKRLVYTSHNVLPHIDGEKHVAELKELHKMFDVILVHGNEIKDEYLKYFPSEANKLKIQYHGVHLTQTTKFDTANVDNKVIDFVSESKGEIVSFVGNIFYNKGADRVISYWLDKHKRTEHRLIVAGNLSKDYKELDEQMKSILQSNNILFMKRYLNDDEYAYILAHSSFIVIPYRHASMSGIVYSAAAFCKPIVYTNTGSIAEYIGPGCGIQSENTDKELYQSLDEMLAMSNDALKEMGSKLHDWIYSNYDWRLIADKLVKEVYTLGE